ncbi:MAG: prepilin peptidase [Lachnospiraceae bacterium]|nr:prepilin peptidase [Lachnospiraceae bacterium]MBR1914447.1 prepilin peptidase [Lachnospiraceae bacterium]
MKDYLFLFTLFICALTDIVSSRIKNCILFASACGLAISLIMTHTASELISSLTSAVLIFAVFFPFFALGCIKAGDIKLMMVAAMYLRIGGLIHIAVPTLAASLILFLLCMKAYGTSVKATRFPFAFALFLGTYPYWNI